MTLATIVVLALAAFRATRVVTTDTISVPFRDRLYSFAWDDEHPIEQDGQQVPAVRAPWRTWLYELFTCPFCLSMYPAAVATIVTDHYYSIPLPWFWWPAIAAGSLATWRYIEQN